ncbi:MAG: hypothetical protein WBQ46_17475 [Terriglobales bacterium]
MKIEDFYDAVTRNWRSDTQYLYDLFQNESDPAVKEAMREALIGCCQHDLEMCANAKQNIPDKSYTVTDVHSEAELRATGAEQTLEEFVTATQHVLDSLLTQEEA